MEEVWKTINGFPKYEVSNTGKIISFVKFSSGKILRQSLRGKGYKFVGLVNSENNRKQLNVHRVVIENFKQEKISADYQCNHINGVKTDNRIDNLEWVTRSGNMKHAYRLGLMPKNLGIQNHKAKLSEADVIEIRSMALSYPRSYITSKYSVGRTAIDSVINRSSWRHIGRRGSASEE